MDISVIIPIYNVKDYVLGCLQSVANQTKKNGIECILVDDHGTDNSMEIAEEFVSLYNGIIDFRIYHHDKNKGLSAARNSGIREANGKYLYFLDSDDTIYPNCLNIMFDAAEKYDADLVQGSYASDVPYVEQFSKQSLPLFSDNHPFIKKTLLNYDVNPVMAQNRLVKKSIIVKNNLFFKEGIIHEDQYWTFFLAKVINRICFIKGETYYYRKTIGSITNRVNIEKETFAFRTLITDFCANIDNIEIGAQKRTIFCLLLSAISSHYYKDKNERTQLISCFKKHNGFFINSLLTLVFSVKKCQIVCNKSINLIMKIFESNSWLCQ